MSFQRPVATLAVAYVTVVSVPWQTAGSVTAIELTATPFVAEIALAQWSSRRIRSSPSRAFCCAWNSRFARALGPHARVEHRGQP